jgi:uncharacterized protein YdeI (BOF family)
MIVIALFTGSLMAQSADSESQNKNSIQTVKMEELLKNPKSYEGKEVAVNGMFNSICCASDFVLKDGFNSMEVYVTDKCPMPDKSKVRSKVEVHGTVKVKGDEVTLIAKEVRFK